MHSPKRTLSPYEFNHLRRSGIDVSDDQSFFERYGEMPVEYITGHVEFAGSTFHVSPDVLIPRIETEELVDMVIKEAMARHAAVPHFSQGERAPDKRKTAIRIADVGTGSGAIACSVARRLAKLSLPYSLMASDISAKALAVARQNWQQLAPEGHLQHVQFMESDLLASIPTEEQFDIIVANLPYIPAARIDALDASVREFEPRVALNGGEDGLQLIDRLLAQAPAHLTTGGVVLLEVDYTHDATVWRQLEPTWKIEVIEDQFSRTRFAQIIKR